MKYQESFILLNKLRFHANHGVLSQERVVGNDYEVSLRLSYPLFPAMQSDDVSDTLNYAEVYQLVQRVMQKPSALLENVAYRIGQALFDTFPKIGSAHIVLIKKNPPMGTDSDGAGVEIHLINDKQTV